MSVNPSHILIARNSRGPNNPSAALSSPTETHAAAAGIFRSAGSPPWSSESYASDDSVSELSGGDEFEDSIDMDPTFTKNAKLPGNVKIVVENTTFWAHKEVLFFASPFFEAALSGHWAETGRPQSMSSVITISQPPTVPGTAHSTSNQVSEMTFAPLDSDCEDGDSDARPEASDSEMSDSEAKEKAREQSNV